MSNEHAQPADPAPAPAKESTSAPEKTPPINKTEQKSAQTKSGFWSQIVEVFCSIFSPDLLTRRMATIFIISFIGILSLSGLQINHYLKSKQAAWDEESRRQSKHFEELGRKDSLSAKERGSLITLGNFTMEIKEEETPETPNYQGLPLANIEVVLLCDTHETREFVEKSTTQVRNQLTNVLVGIEREELLSRDGKKKLKASIIKRLNDWLPHGKVKDVYFPKLMIN